MKKVIFFKQFFLIGLLFLSSLQAECFNDALHLNHKTYDLSDRVEYIDNNAEFVSVLAAYQVKEIGRGFAETIDGTLNPFSAQQEDFLSEFTGYINIVEAGVYTFAIDGDDAVELIIDGNVTASWYGAHGACNCTTHAGTVNLSSGKHAITFRHHERGGSSLYRLYWKTPSQSTFSVIPSGTFYHCTPKAPLADYKFDECVIDESVSGVKDSSSNHYDGNASNTETTNSEKVLVRSANFSANGISDYVQLNPTILNAKSDFSVAMWVKGNSTQDQTLISMANTSSYNEALLFITNGGTTFSPHIKGTTANVTIPDITDNTWHHLVWKRNGATGETCLVIDGNTTVPYCVTIAKTGPITVQGLIVGQEQDSLNCGFASEQDFEGYMDELKFYDSLLSDADIAEIYINEKNGRSFDGLVSSEVFCSTEACSHYGAQLNINTYNLSSYTGGQIDSHGEFVTVVANYAQDAYRFGSGLIAQINTQGVNNNPFGADELYLTIIDGFIKIPSSGVYTLMVNGDDAVEVLVDGVVASSWYGGHASSATPESTSAISKVALNLVAGYHKIEFHHHENTGSDSYELYWKKPGDSNFRRN